MPILRPHAARFHEWRMSCVTLMSAHLYGNVYIPVGVARALSDSSDFGLLGEQSSQKMGDSLPWMPMNCRAKFDAASFILGGEICNRTNEQTHKQAVTDISTLTVTNDFILGSRHRVPLSSIAVHQLMTLNLAHMTTGQQRVDSVSSSLRTCNRQC